MTSSISMGGLSLMRGAGSYARHLRVRSLLGLTGNTLTPIADVGYPSACRALA